MRTILSTLLLFATALSTTAAAAPAHHRHRAKAARAALVVTSSAFKNTEAIPREYTCEGVARTPPIAWSKVPDGTKSFAILVEDVNAPKGPFTHWLVTGIPASTTAIEPGAPLPADAMVSRNDAGRDGYAAPCPDAGRHQYVFHVYALDIPLAKQLTRAAFLGAIKGHVLARGEMSGTYEKGK